MKKIIITCPKCKSKMKIMDKVAKYRCPNCKEIYKFNHFKKFIRTITGFFEGIFQTFKDIKQNFITKYRNTKATYNYMKQMKQNMKNNPNWSNYHREQAEEKKMKQAQKPKFWDKFKK
ncbi:zf-TFIIB domain-containing protein [Cetobacterium sp. 8H]|uniref:TFIIB-type zinc ribbon-containing protein n=1 Tax=Cetobacterium sp. 8H TaxID=2759681 RepID=UPI00163C7970|nr:zf-TFIIB domain-containing protein [Cetobacterium sp. 8H]MBC2851079.1 zf-TFIIB domain-containing protein [Cetobacterium sp. 8H]